MITLHDKWLMLGAIQADPSLSTAAGRVAYALLDHLNCKTGQCNPCIETIAIRVGRKRRTISAAITELIKAGWLFQIRTRGACRYVFALDRIASDAPDMKDTETHSGTPKCSKYDAQKTAHHRRDDARKIAYLDAQEIAHPYRNLEFKHRKKLQPECGTTSEPWVQPLFVAPNDPRWPRLAAKFEAVHGKSVPEVSIRGQRGYLFPTTWLSEAAAPSEVGLEEKALGPSLPLPCG